MHGILFISGILAVTSTVALDIVALHDSAELLHYGPGNSNRDVVLSLPAAGEILARSLGLLGSGSRASDLTSQRLPTGDLLERPEAAVLLLVTGVNDVVDIQSVAPNLASLVKVGWSSPLDVPNTESAASAAARLVRPSTVKPGSTVGSLPEQLRASFSGGSVVSASASPALSRAMLGGQAAATVHYTGGDLVASASGGAMQIIASTGVSPAETLRAELAAFEALADHLRSTGSRGNAPDLALLGISALSDASGAEYDDTLQELDAAMPSLIAKIDAVYSERVVVEIVLVSAATVREEDESFVVGEEASARVSRRLAVGATNSNDGFEGAAYLLKIWTVVVLSFVVLAIIVCAPWSDELDPILRTSIKSDGHRKRE